MAKRNANGGGSIRKRKDGTWEGRFTVGRDPRTGRQVQRSVYGKTQAEVRQKLTAATREIDGGTYLAPNRMTVAAWCERVHTGRIRFPATKPHHSRPGPCAAVEADRATDSAAIQRAEPLPVLRQNPAPGIPAVAATGC